MEFPSTRAVTTATCLEKGSLFMSSIMLERSGSVKKIRMHGPRKIFLPIQRQRPYIAPRGDTKAMTVCIAAICDTRDSIVAVSDSKISAEYTSGDNIAMKGFGLSKNGHWRMMYAANDVSPISSLVNRIRQQLENTPNHLSAVTAGVQTAYREEIADQRLNRSIKSKKMTLGIDLCVFGFDEQSKAHVFGVSDPDGKITNYDIPGFHSIGTGSWLADAMLYFYGQQIITPATRTIFHALAGKFMAEPASDVGEKTNVWVFTSAGKAIPLDDRPIREMWESEGKPRIPHNCDERISQLYREG